MQSTTEKRNLKRPFQDPNEIVLRETFTSSQPLDRFDYLTKNWTEKIRLLSNEQRIIAEKLINDTLYEAELQHLTYESRITGIRRSSAQAFVQTGFISHNSPTPSSSQEINDSFPQQPKCEPNEIYIEDTECQVYLK